MLTMIKITLEQNQRQLELFREYFWKKWLFYGNKRGALG